MSTLVSLRGLSRSYGSVMAVHPLDLDIEAGDFLTILGPSGCGKTTLLRMIGGFIDPDGGTIEIDGEDVTRLSPERRPTNMVFQSYGLFPHMTVRQNVGYGLRVAGVAEAERQDRVSDILGLVHMTDYAERNVEALSGGQQQRIALARALVMKPKVLLLDEPLAALDLKLRQAMQDELRRIHAQIGGTFVFVTHDQGEALALSNRIAVMNEGRVEQVADPETIYRKPSSLFVSTFIGEANVFSGTRSQGHVTLDAGPDFADSGPDGPIRLVLRPELARLDSASGPSDLSLACHLRDIVYQGAFTKFELAGPDDQPVTVVCPNLNDSAMPQSGDAIMVTWRSADHTVLDVEP